MTRRQQSAFANPVLIGAVTVLVLLVAVFLAYNANEGLPFVPTRELKVDIANGSELVAGNDVREGGYLIGIVSDLKPVTLENGQAGAQLTLKLNKAYGQVPIDSSVSIQPRSVLGLKYLDLHKGTSTAHVRRRRDAPGVADERARSSSTTSSRCSTPRPGRRPRRIWSGSATRWLRGGRR